MNPTMQILRLEAMLAHAEIGIMQLHVPTGTITTNSVFRKLFGVSLDANEASDSLLHWIDRIHPDDRPKVMVLRGRLLAGEVDSCTIDYRVSNDRGGWYTVRSRTLVVERDAQGGRLWIGSVYYDISHATEIERRFHALMDRPFQFSGILTPDGILLDTNQASLQHTGDKLQDVVGKPFWEMGALADSPLVREQIKDGIARAAKGENIRFEIPREMPDGTMAAVDFTLTPLRDADGTIVNIIPEGRDITEVVRTREALRATQSRLDMATEGANLGIWEWNLQTGELWCNNQWFRMLGYEPGEIPATAASAMELCHPVELAELLASQQAHIDGNTHSYRAELRMRHKDGTWHQVLVRGRASKRDRDGRAIRVAGVNADITERRNLEVQLAAALRLESIGQLAAGVAHEINTPVQYITDSVYFVRDGLSDLLTMLRGLMTDPTAAAAAAAANSEDLQYLQDNLPLAVQRAIDGLTRVTEIVSSMKEFSHPEQSEKTQVDISRAIRNTLVVAKSEYKYVAEVTTQFAELPLVACHGGEFSQLLLNLVVNAAHAIADVVKDSGQMGSIVVSARADGDCVVVSVADNGGGIPEAIRNRIFEPFFTTKAVGKGSGQGLSIVNNIVKSHGGSISFETEIGRGTTFHVRLPVAGPAAGQTEQAA